MLSQLGVTDEDIKKEWGEELFNINKEASVNPQKDLIKFQNKYSFDKKDNYEEAFKTLKDDLSNAGMNPDVNSETIQLNKLILLTELAYK
jgi:hypothetical protein